MRGNAKKPKILKTKIKVAGLFRDLAKEKGLRFRRPSWENNKAVHSMFYWTLDINFKGVDYCIYFQRYVRKRGVDFVHIRYKNGYKHLTVKEIHSLHKELQGELS